ASTACAPRRPAPRRPQAPPRSAKGGEAGISGRRRPSRRAPTRRSTLRGTPARASVPRPTPGRAARKPGASPASPAPSVTPAPVLGDLLFRRVQVFGAHELDERHALAAALQHG